MAIYPVYISGESLSNRPLRREDFLTAATNMPLEGCGLVVVNLDKFRRINTTYGISVGDAVIEAVERRLSEAIRPGDIVGRLNGDEYAVIVGTKNLNVAQLYATAERIRGAVCSMVSVGEILVTLSASAGATIIGEDSIYPSLEQTDLAVQNAKQSGGQRSVVYSPTVSQAAQMSTALSADIAKAVHVYSDQFDVDYQPIVDVHTGRMRSVEAIARWNHPEHGVLPARTFVPVAQNAGVGVELDKVLAHHILDDICAQPDRWEGCQVHMNMYAGGGNNSAENLLRLAEQILAQVGPGQMVLETPSTPELDTSAELAGAWHEVVRRGVGMAVEDFGAGYSHLARLNELPVTVLKTHPSLVLASSEQLLRVTAALAGALGATVVACGVDSRAQHNQVLTSGVSAAQGAWYGLPVPAETLPLPV